MLKPVLLILHQEHSSPGRVGQTLAKLGYPLDIRRPRFGDPLPETMDEHAGAAIFGGPQSANDNELSSPRDDWIGALRTKPYLGICLARNARVIWVPRCFHIRKVASVTIDPADRGWPQGLRGMPDHVCSAAPRRFQTPIRR
jgi:hypothetical protein